MDRLVRAVADNLRATRTARHLSLTQLAARSGVAKSTLSQIESACANPTLGTLTALAEALGVALEDLLATPQRSLAVTVVRAGEGTDFSDEAVAARLVASLDLPASVGEFHHLALRIRARETSAGHGPGAREHAMVISGRVRVGPLGHEVDLDAGDYAGYAADAPHTWMALGQSSPQVWLYLHSPRITG